LDQKKTGANSAKYLQAINRTTHTQPEKSGHKPPGQIARDSQQSFLFVGVLIAPRNGTKKCKIDLPVSQFVHLEVEMLVFVAEGDGHPGNSHDETLKNSIL